MDLRQWALNQTTPDTMLSDIAHSFGVNITALRQLWSEYHSIIADTDATADGCGANFTVEASVD